MGMKNAKRCISFLMAVILILGLMPAEGIILMAAETDSNIENSSEDGVLYRDYNIESKEWSEKFCKDYNTLTKTSVSTLDADWYVVEGEVSFYSLTISGEVHLILTNGCKLTVSSGVHVPESSSLTIYAQSEGENMGILEATGADGVAGIGGYGDNKDDNFNNGAITINGGKITAKGSNFGAGIGSGSKNAKSSGVKGSNIIINGGDVTAIGGYNAAGIGGGNYADGTYITINGGKVTATGGSSGAGIGGGYYYKNNDTGEILGNGENITINGGEVIATGSYGAAGIGGGDGGHGENITINEGKVTAKSGSYAAAIGGGIGSNSKNGYGKNIYIKGGEVEAVGGENGTGIGGGYACDGTYIYIEGGQVTAAGGENAAGIGGSYAGNGKNIYISGGKVTATGGVCGAGIGGGQYYSDERNDGANGTNISIENCEVTATGGWGAAGIGGGSSGGYTGSNANGTDISIINSKVIAIGGDVAAGIGGGNGLGNGNSGNGTDISIENSIVWATGDVNAIDTTYPKHIGKGRNGSESNITKKNSIIFEGSTGLVHQKASLEEGKEIEIKAGETLTIPQSASLSLSGSIINNGELTIYDKDRLYGKGSLSGSGKFWIEIADFTADDIIVPQGMVYNGTDQTDYVKKNSGLNLTENTKRSICNTEFTVKKFNTTGWTKSTGPFQIKNAGTYSVTYRKYSQSLSKNFTVAKSATTYNDNAGNTTLKSYEGAAQKTQFIYGSNITLKVVPRLTGTAAQSETDTLQTAAYQEPQAGEIAVFMQKDDGEIQLTEAKPVASGSEVSFDISTVQYGLASGTYTLSVRYTGTENMADYSEDIDVEVNYHNATDSAVLTGNKGENGWYTGPVTIQAPQGYQISKYNTEQAEWSGSLAAADLTLDENGDYIYFLKETQTGYITDKMVLASAKIDSTKPVFGDFTYTEGKAGEGIFIKIWNWLIGKDYITVTAPIIENGSGLEKDRIEIHLTDSGGAIMEDAIENITLTGSTDDGYTISFVIPADFDGYYSIMAKDTAGNESVIKSQRAVIDTAVPEISVNLNNAPYDETKNIFESKAVIDINVNDSANNKISAGLKSVTYSLDNNSPVSLEPKEGFNGTEPIKTADGQDIEITQKGAHTLMVAAEDHAGNKIEKNISFQIYYPTTLTLSEKSGEIIIYDKKPIEAGIDFVIEKEGSKEEARYFYQNLDLEESGYQAGLPTDSGNYRIKVEIPQDNENFYFGAEATLELVIEKAQAEGNPHTIQVVKQKKHTVSYDLSEMLPEEVKGSTIYSIKEINNKDGLLSQDTLPSAGELNQSALSLNTEAVQEAGKRAVLTISFSNANYEISNALLIIETTEKIPLEISGIEISGAEQQKLIYSGNAASYSGEPKAETKDGQVVSLENSDYQFLWYQMENDTYTEIPDNTPPVNVGSYKLIIKGENSDYLGTQEIPFEIVKMDISDAAVTLGEELIFNGSVQTQTLAEVKAGGLSLTEKDYTITENTGCEAGTYTMTITGTGNFTGTAEKKFAIAPLPVKLVWNTPTFTYDGETHSVSADVSNAVSGYKVSVSAYDNDSAVDAGNYTAKAKALDNANYTLEGGADLSAEYTIERLDISERTDLEVLLGDALVYNGEAQTQGVTSIKIKDMDVTCQISGNSGTNAGTYIMTLTGTGNFTGSKNIYFVIQKAKAKGNSHTIQIVKQKKHTVFYDLSKMLSEEVKGAVTYSVADIDNKDGLLSEDTLPSTGGLNQSTLSLNTEAVQEVGKRAVLTISFSNANYEISDALLTIETTDKIPVKISGIEISGAEQQKVVYSGGSVSYSGEPKAETEDKEVISLEDSDYQYLWYQMKNDAYTEMPENTPPAHVGNYKLIIRAENNNYLGEQEILFEIVKRDISDAAVTLGEELIFNGSAQMQTLAEVKSGSLVLTEDEYTIAGNIGCETGAYTLTVTGCKDFTGTVEKEFTIQKLDITGRTDLEILLGNSLIYNGAVQTQEITSVKLGNLEADFEILNNSAKDAGTYTLTIMGTGNFTGSTKADFVILQAENAPNMPDSAISTGIKNGRKVSDIPLKAYAGWAWSAEDADKLLPVEENESLTALAYYQGEDKENYKNITQRIVITMIKCEHPEEQVHVLTEYEPTCTKEGMAYRYCEKCNMVIEENIKIDVLGHSYGAPKFFWAEDFASAKAEFICERTGCTEEEDEHKKSIEAEVETKVNGNITVYTAKVLYNGTLYTEEKQVVSEKEETRLQISEGIADIPESLKEAGYDTEEKIVEACCRTVLGQTGYQKKQTVMYDIMLQVSFDGGKTWENATEENFPKEGIVVAVPYPKGTNEKDFDFLVTHMFSHTMNGFQAGEIETPEVTKTEKELLFTVKGLSPIMIAWKSLSGKDESTETPSDETTKAPSNETTAAHTTDKPSKKPESPKTGDCRETKIWILLSVLSILELTAVYYSKRKKSK